MVRSIDRSMGFGAVYARTHRRANNLVVPCSVNARLGVSRAGPITPRGRLSGRDDTHATMPAMARRAACRPANNSIWDTTTVNTLQRWAKPKSPDNPTSLVSGTTTLRSSLVFFAPKNVERRNTFPVRVALAGGLTPARWGDRIIAWRANACCRCDEFMRLNDANSKRYAPPRSRPTTRCCASPLQLRVTRSATAAKPSALVAVIARPTIGGL